MYPADIPIEEQHGGKIDVVLHKLTEDILCLSQMQSYQQSVLPPQPANPHQVAALRRVQRLVEFTQRHPECSLVDDPANVQALMSRAEIAVKLQGCLQRVHTAAGIVVRSPAYAVVREDDGCSDVLQRLRFPIIVKPLTAAGTKASHAMAVLLDSSCPIPPNYLPCLCQEYTNHDAVLYKVYVLGDHVSVHRRRSLPNLPVDEVPTRQFVEFDSQRPYPRLADFGFDLAVGEARKRPRRSRFPAPPSSAEAHLSAAVTADQVRPIVDALKRAFGLELFGFDIIVSEEDEEMLVVDVNYFPSYKEVPNFPSLLARYLTDKALANRRRANQQLQQHCGGEKGEEFESMNNRSK
jgi:Inositol 1,3,4-trisphosphate 5/6-kinase ATP-grasp domain/Inositol 1,3,4-trisphosphate 5/6-kinase pre-ATP-grasp domain